MPACRSFSALEILANQQENKSFQKVLTGVRCGVESGATLSVAMKQYAKVFDASTSTWWKRRNRRYSRHYSSAPFHYIEKNVKLKRAVKSALIYPVVVLIIAVSVITLLLWKVVPIFATLFAGLGVDFPLPTESSSASATSLAASSVS